MKTQRSLQTFRQPVELLLDLAHRRLRLALLLQVGRQHSAPGEDSGGHRKVDHLLVDSVDHLPVDSADRRKDRPADTGVDLRKADRRRVDTGADRRKAADLLDSVDLPNKAECSRTGRRVE